MTSFEKYSNKELVIMVKETIEALDNYGTFHNKQSVYKVWKESCMSDMEFVKVLYNSFAIRYGLFKNYNEYLTDAINRIN